MAAPGKRKLGEAREQFTPPARTEVRMRELFIYYQAKVIDEAALKAAAVELQTRLRARFDGLRTRLLRRPDAVDGLFTWMETYALPATLDADALQRDIEAAAAQTLARWTVGARHVEVFVACAS
jgi:hypothetical protein